MKQAYFETLNAALNSEGLLDAWDSSMQVGIEYGETRSWHYDAPNGDTRYISVYRDNDGRYERPVHYITQKAKGRK